LKEGRERGAPQTARHLPWALDYWDDRIKNASRRIRFFFLDHRFLGDEFSQRLW